MNKMQLTLVFNPAYDGGAYVPEQGKERTRFFRKYVGGKGLLDELELRLGLTAREPVFRQQLTAYLKAVKQVADKDETLFCARSFHLASLATAKELLAWRDELVLAGWTASSPIPDGLTTGAKAILKGLAAVEKELGTGFRTESDRWQAVLAELEKGRAPEGISVLVTVQETHLHPLFKTLFNQLRQQGIQVDTDIASHDPNVEIKHFRDSVDASLWAAADEGNSLLVCADSQTLGMATAALGQACANTVSTDTPKPVEHLFVSAMMLLKDGNDLQAMRDYLASPSHPLNAFKKQNENGPSLREALLRHIIKKGGFGEDKNKRSFRDIVDEYANGDKARLKTICSFLPATGAKLTFERIKGMCDRLANWATGAIKKAEKDNKESPYADQWSAIAGYCGEMVCQCRELGFETLPEIAPNDFLQAVRSVYTPAKETFVRAEVGSASVITDIKSIAGETENVIWVDGAFAQTPVPLSFLCKEDTRTLARVLPCIWAQEDALALEDDLFKAGLSRISGNLTILYCDSFQGEKKEKHPFIVQQADGVKALEELPYEKIPDDRAEMCITRSANTVMDSYPVNAGGLELPDHESPSSLELMFEQPFDWFVRYVLGLYEEGDTNMSLIEGLVAHDVIHKIFVEAAAGGNAVTADAFELAFQAKFDTFFYQALLDTGAELTLTENTVECRHFKTVLREEGISELIRIIRFSGLTIVGSEIECKNVDLSEPGFEPLRISATIDLLLKNPAGRYVILDFKWAGSTGRKERETQVKKGTDYQLALYRRIVETGTADIPANAVDAQGFYMLRTAELLTAQDTFHDGRGPVNPVPPSQRPPRMSPDETMADIQARYSELIQSLKAGSIPAGDLKSPYLRNKVLKGKLN